jgi:hypothetical protein
MLVNIIFVVDPYGIWTSFKMILTHVMLTLTNFLKVNGVNC